MGTQAKGKNGVARNRTWANCVQSRYHPTRPQPLAPFAILFHITYCTPPLNPRISQAHNRMSRPLTVDEAHVHKVIGSRVGLEEVEGIEDVSIIAGNIKCSVENSVVYKIKGTESLLIFGKQGSPIDLDKLRKMYEDSITNTGRKDHEAAGLYNEVTDDQEKKEPPQASPESTDEKLSEEDIKLIGSQVKASRDDIINALVESNYDVVDAMMKLTK